MLVKVLLLCGFVVLNIMTATANDTYQQKSPHIRRRSRMRSLGLNQTMDVDENEDDGTDDSVLSLLHKINNRLTVMSMTSEQQMRKLETFEYRMTRLEVQLQEKTENLHSDVKELSRKVTQFDWQNNRMESLLDVLKSDTTFLKQAVEYFRISPGQGRDVAGSAEMGLDVSSKLQTVLGGVQTLLNSFVTLRSDVSALKRNITNIGNSTSLIADSIPQLVTTKYFQRSFLEYEKRAYQPIYALSGNTNSASQEKKPKLPHDCSEVQRLGNTQSGVYRIHPPHATSPFFAYCDLKTHGGGWTVIQKRSDGTTDFYKGWHDYKYGFGNLGGEFWLGLEKIHFIANFQVNEILIELEDFTLEKVYASYSSFAVGTEVEGYPITFLGNYNGTAGDSLMYHAGQKFSTFDMDHDNWEEGNCAKSHTGAWWYNGCDTSNLNGKYLNGQVPDLYEYQGMYWYEWRGPLYSLKGTKIMIRPVSRTTLIANTTHNYDDTNDREDEFRLMK